MLAFDGKFLTTVTGRTTKIQLNRESILASPFSHSADLSSTFRSSFALNSDVRQLARRLAHLESLFEATNPGLLPKDAPIPRIAGSSKPSPASHSADYRSPASPYQQDPPANGEPVKREDSTSDTEDAAVTLEDVAFGARVPVLRALSSTGNAPEGPKRTTNSSRMDLELNEAFTSILAEPLSYDQDGRPRSAVRLGLDLAISTEDLPTARSGSMAQIFAVLPGKDITDFLINKYFAEASSHRMFCSCFADLPRFTQMEWDYRVLDPEAFPVEHERYTEMLAEGREDLIDPLFVAVLCMVSRSSAQTSTSAHSTLAGTRHFPGRLLVTTRRRQGSLAFPWPLRSRHARLASRLA